MQLFLNGSVTKRCRKPQTVVPLRPLGVVPHETGHIEVDTVAHCGDSMSGTFGWTVTATDILSSWTDEVTVWGKSAEEVRECQAVFDLTSLHGTETATILDTLAASAYKLIIATAQLRTAKRLTVRGTQ
jgi:hypothetical protein